LNLLSNSETTAGTGTVNVLSSLDRSSSGVAASDIAVRKQDLGTDAGGIVGTWTSTAGDTGTLNGTQTDSLAVAAPTAAATVYSLAVFGTDADDSSFAQADFRTGAAAAPANATELEQIMYISRDGDTAGDVAKGLETAFKVYAAENGLDTDVLSVTATSTGIDIASSVTDATDTLAVGVYTGNAGAGAVATIGGGLEALAGIDVSSTAGADSALTSIEFMIDTAIDSAAAFGSVQGRIEIQSEFVSKITDALKSGIGTLVDANMEEASARLQALQVQQQLGVQSLSIANQAPQSILSLFR
jgi:flagellin